MHSADHPAVDNTCRFLLLLLSFRSPLPRQWIRCLICYCLVVLLLGCGSDVSRQQSIITGSTMGTTYSIQFDRLPPDWTPATFEAAVNDRLQHFNQRYSTYLDDSLISQFNRSESTGWFPVPAAFMELVDDTLRLSEVSSGAFDITVQPLVQQWGFGATAIRQRPTDAAVSKTLGIVGYKHLQLRQKPPALRKDHPGLQIDLSAIAKGKAVDELAEWLLSLGIQNWLVEIGGELRARGVNNDGEPWQIGIQQPDSASPQAVRVIAVNDQAVATSGDYQNYFIEEGKRYSHLIDPRTGYPVTHQTASVTVIAESATMADAWATTLLIAGEEAGMQLADQHSIQAVFIVREGEALQTYLTASMHQ